MCSLFTLFSVCHITQSVVMARCSIQLHESAQCDCLSFVYCYSRLQIYPLLLVADNTYTIGKLQSKIHSTPFEAPVLAWERIMEKSTDAYPTYPKQPLSRQSQRCPNQPPLPYRPEGKHDTLPETSKARADGFIRGTVTLTGRRYHVLDIPVALSTAFHR